MNEIKKFIIDMENTLSCGLQTKNKCKDLEEEEEKVVKKILK